MINYVFDWVKTVFICLLLYILYMFGTAMLKQRRLQA